MDPTTPPTHRFTADRAARLDLLVAAALGVSRTQAATLIAGGRVLVRGRSERASFVPDLGDEAKNRKLHGLVSAFVRDIAGLIEDEREKGKRR